MVKVIQCIRTEFARVPEVRATWQRANKRCQICGNAFWDLGRNAKSCEFCKTPCNGTVALSPTMSMLATG